ncbi:thymidine kinase [Candidatus Bipolaricaulota bacterium]|nr:thymidine kinase [Candidatus Bipolaricaulota bacterium]
MLGRRENEKAGTLEVVTGVMFAGKTTYLLRRLHKAIRSERRVVVFKPSIDTRYAENACISHAGERHHAHPIPYDTSEIRVLERAAGYAFLEADVVAFDEANFFTDSFVRVCQEIVSRGVTVIVAGAHIDFARRPFGPMPKLLALADSVVLRKTKCAVCGEEATCYQRLINGQPAPLDGPLIMLGGAELYEPRCTQCYEYERGRTPPATSPTRAESRWYAS